MGVRGRQSVTGGDEEQALIRECWEELTVILSASDVFMEADHDYPDLNIHLTLFNATISVGTPKLLEHNDIYWITVAEISTVFADRYTISKEAL